MSMIQKRIGNKETVFISEADQYLFGQGTHYEIYKKLGAHLSVEDGIQGTFFAVWAPNAQTVHVIGEFNEWNEQMNPMTCIGGIGIYQTFIPQNLEGQLYKYVITTKEGDLLYKADPFANWAEFRPGTASKVADLSRYSWQDEEWLLKRAKKNLQTEPMAVYECHIGSWMRHPLGGDQDGFYNYREFADHISAYLKTMKYTHVELMGIAEYPYDGSWGYQVTGYYAPTSRYGTPEDFMYLIDTLHKINVSVLLDWVPAHFPKDAHGLALFDGTPLFEYPNPKMGEHPDWGTKVFNYSKSEVRNFLIANALFWIKEYHIDGLRVDAVASMLYLDYGKKQGQWVPNSDGGNKNMDAVEFFKHLNSIVDKQYPGVAMIAEESTAWPNVTGKPQEDGLGFTFKWNMGWMHDFCEYMKLDPFFRKGSHHRMTFAMSYNNSENYILPLSHDEVVHLKCSMVEKMPGYKTDKYANLRVGFTYMFGHSGKKLLFMGQDFGQEREWNENAELDWFLLSEQLNKGMQDYVGELLKIYSDYPCLYEIDNNWSGFEWISVDDSSRSIYAFVRKGFKDKKRLLFVMNMTPIERLDFRVGVLEQKKHKLLLNSDEIKFGGQGLKMKQEIIPEEKVCDFKKFSISFDLPAYGAVIFEF